MKKCDFGIFTLGSSIYWCTFDFKDFELFSVVKFAFCIEDMIYEYLMESLVFCFYVIKCI
jgi:hypothetical protein